VSHGITTIPQSEVATLKVTRRGRRVQCTVAFEYRSDEDARAVEESMKHHAVGERVIVTFLPRGS